MRLFVPEERGDHLQMLRLGHVEECEGAEQRQEPGHMHPKTRGGYPVRKTILTVTVIIDRPPYTEEKANVDFRITERRVTQIT